MNREKLSLLAKDLTKEYPRSPRETLGGYVIAARSVDKCRAALLGINGEYNYYPVPSLLICLTSPALPKKISKSLSQLERLMRKSLNG